MTNLVQKFEEKQMAEILGDRVIPKFKAGDTLRVKVRIVEGKTERVQAYEGLCIARKNGSINSSFTVRKISHGEGVERVFPLYSPRVEEIEVIRRGVVRRAKLYYMRDLTGKAARITEKRDYTTKNEKKAADKVEVAKTAGAEEK
jgi:large subunit ribosomal protein L19